jgi:hypothetical protein
MFSRAEIRLKFNRLTGSPNLFFFFRGKTVAIQIVYWIIGVMGQTLSNLS